MTNGFVTHNLSARNYECVPTNYQHQRQRIFMERRSYCAFDGIKSVIYYELLQLNQTINAERYRHQLLNLNQAFEKTLVMRQKIYQRYSS